MNEDLCKGNYDNSTIDGIFNEILENAIQKLESDNTLNNIYREASRLRLAGGALKKFFSDKVLRLIYGKSSSYLLSLDEIKNQLYEKIKIDYHSLKEQLIDESTIKTMLINKKEYNYFYRLYVVVNAVTELDSRMDEIENQSKLPIEVIPEPEIPKNIKLRHSIFLLHEFGIIRHLETELKNRGIDRAQQNRNYLSSLLSVLMNVNDISTQETIRKEVSQHAKIKTPINSLNKILAPFGLEVKNLK